VLEACEDRPDTDLLRIVTFLMGDLAKRSETFEYVRRCLRLIHEIVATPGNTFASKLAAIGDGSKSCAAIGR
jgi:hypothetical protein